MTCEQFKNNLVLLKNGETLSNKAQLHLNSCDTCRAVYNSYIAFYKTLEIEKGTEVSPLMVDRVMTELKKSHPLKDIIIIRKSFQIAAVILALLTGFWGAWLFDSKPGNSELILSDYFFNDQTALEIENSWLNFELYEE